MDLRMIQEGGVGAYGAIALGALGILLGAFALIALLGKSRSAFALGVVTLVFGAAAAGAGMLGTVYGRYQTERALIFVGSGLDLERIHRAGFREAQSASWVGFFAALLPLALGGAAALLGSRLQRPQSRMQAFAEPVVSSDEGLGQTVVAGVFLSITALAVMGTWAMAHSELPKLRYSFDELDHDAWSLAAALEDVQKNTRPNACERLGEALQPFWAPEDKREWPRKLRREIPQELAAWREAADGCAKRALEALESGEGEWTQDDLLDSVLLQDQGLHARALAWTAKAPDAPATPAPTEPRVGSGSLGREDILRVIRGDLKGIRTCYERELMKSPKLEGKVVVQFRVGPDGRVSSAEDASEQPFPSAKVTTCVLARFKNLRFPKPIGGGEVNVKYPFIFKSSS